MTSLPSRICLALSVLLVIRGDFLDPPREEPLRSLAEDETVLPCRYKAMDGNVMVQVTWYKELSDGSKEQIITAHHDNGQTAFGSWSRRVRFKNSDPVMDSSLVIISTEVSDEGNYLCHISTFPSGNFDRAVSLIVWTMPISSLDPVILVEGQSYRQAAACRSVARPPPRLSWDTDLNGQSINRSSDNGAVSSLYSVHPLRGMNGKKLDCLVWHPTFSGPRRIQNKLVVHYPPNAEVPGHSSNWYVGQENAALTCVSGGNPRPHIFTWIRLNGELPKGAVTHDNGTLAFGRPLNVSDSGIYQCAAKNDVGVGKADVEVIVKARPERQTDLENLMVIIVGAAAGGLLLLMLIVIISITCHHKRKNKRLKLELTEKKEEISTLSRQASFRRMNSISTDTRGATEENIPLRVEGMRTSMSSLGEQAQCRDSRSTISGGRGGGGGGGAYDYLGRPVLYNSSRRGRERPLDRDEENRLRVETYVRNSSISLQETRFHPPLAPSSFPMSPSSDIVRQLNGGAIVPSDGDPRQGLGVAKTHQVPPANYPPPVTDDEDEVDEGLGGPASQENHDDQDSETNSSQVSEAPSARYQQSNGTMRPKSRTNGPVGGPHASLIHKAQIV
ncbi:unnamed protein product [Ophioblennius macclurei]